MSQIKKMGKHLKIQQIKQKFFYHVLMFIQKHYLHFLSSQLASSCGRRYSICWSFICIKSILYIYNWFVYGQIQPWPILFLNDKWYIFEMQVPSYGDILVRVCIDCYKQTLGDTSDLNESNTSTKSAINDFWLLTTDPNHNEIVRTEFSYEDAPSITLCLSILKFHRKTVEYPR